MGNSLGACFVLTLIVPSFALPFGIRSNIGPGNNVSTSVSMGIVIAIFVIFLIPLLWCVYKLGTRTRRTTSSVYVSAPLIFPTTPNYDDSPNLPPSGQITRPHPVHKKVSRPTSRA